MLFLFQKDFLKCCEGAKQNYAIIKSSPCDTNLQNPLWEKFIGKKSNEVKKKNMVILHLTWV